MLLHVLLTLMVSIANAQELTRPEISVTASTAADYLLPGNVVPVLYQLELEPDFDTDTFRGSINITLSVVSTGDTVTLHTMELEIDQSDISLLDENGDVVNSILETAYSNDDRQFYTITFEEVLEEGSTYTLVIDVFTGILNEDNNGFYLAWYTNEEGVDRKLATSTFEPTFARRAYPCFDEPALKAEYDISIIRTSEYDSLSNAPLVSTEEISDGRFRDVFARTPRMSSYLVVFVVSDYTYVVEENQRVFGRPEAIAGGFGDYALSAGISILNILEEYTGVPYTLPKMDQIGIPNEYYDWGAMENWGLVTYREDALLFSSNQGIAEIIAHEFAHQWFGNIVSPLWWSYIWLNEGFATYLQYYAASIEIGYDFVTRIAGISQYALWVDSYEGTRPMNQDAGSPDDLLALFDSVAYYKAASVIRMAEGVLSTEVFREGLNVYLNRMEFDAAQPSDLYSSWQDTLDEAGSNPLPDGEDVESVMTTWDSHAGYPLLTVTRNYTDGSVTFSQKRFIWTDPDNDDESIWYIPISYATQSNADFSDPSPRLWLTQSDITLDLEGLQVDDWLVVNIQQSGYYRVNYDEDNWYRIIDFLGTDEADQIHSVNVAQLVDDAYELFNAGVLDPNIYLELTEVAGRKTNYAVLQSFVNTLSRLDPHLSETDIYRKFQTYVLEILETPFNSVGLTEDPNDNALTKLTRQNVLTWMCAYGHEACQDYAIAQLKKWQRDGSITISPYLQVPLLCTAVKLGEPSDWEFVFQKYITADRVPVPRKNLLKALGCSEDKNVVDKYLNVILDTGRNIAPSDRLTALSSIYTSSGYGRTHMSNYINDNWPLLRKRFSSSQLSSMINEIASKLSTQEELAEMEHLAVQTDGQSIFKAGLDTLKFNVAWTEKYLHSIADWLNKRY